MHGTYKYGMYAFMHMVYLVHLLWYLCDVSVECIWYMCVCVYVCTASHMLLGVGKEGKVNLQIEPLHWLGWQESFWLYWMAESSGCTIQAETANRSEYQPQHDVFCRVWNMDIFPIHRWEVHLKMDPKYIQVTEKKFQIAYLKKKKSHYKPGIDWRHRWWCWCRNISLFLFLFIPFLLSQRCDIVP